MTDVSVLDFGAVGDGVCDCYAAFQAALDSGAQTVRIPHGVYGISDTLKVPSHTRIVADATAKIQIRRSTPMRRGDFLLRNADTAGGNVDICIEGGIWDGNNRAAETRKADISDPDGYSGALLNFLHVEGLTLRGMTLANSSGYYVRMSRLHHFTIENVSFVSDEPRGNQDGLHFGGDCKHGRVKNIRALSLGQTNDDLIALNADDCVHRVENYDLVRDDIEDIDMENLYAESCHSILRLATVTAVIRDIRIRNVYGGYRCYAINADATRYCRTPLFQDADYPVGVGRIRNVSIENMVCRPMPEAIRDRHPAILLESLSDGLSIQNFTVLATDAGGDEPCAALCARNLTGQTLVIDGQTVLLSRKEDAVSVPSLHSLSTAHTLPS